MPVYKDHLGAISEAGNHTPLLSLTDPLSIQVAGGNPSKSGNNIFI